MFKHLEEEEDMTHILGHFAHPLAVPLAFWQAMEEGLCIIHGQSSGLAG